MKNLMYAGAVLFAASTINLAPPVLAEELIATRSNITPYALVSSGYQGQLKPQGIPSAAVFERNARSGKLTAIDLIEAGIASGRLPESILEDRSYVQAVGGVLERVVKN